MSKQRKIESNHYYHIYSRGVNKCLTFLEHKDYARFQEYIKKCNTQKNIKLQYSQNILTTKKIVDIISYCLMPNHFHFILKEKIEGGISLFMQKVLSGYVSYFNKKYNRTGALFGSRFRDKIIEDDIYFQHLFTYIWNNPIKIINPNYDSKDLLNGRIELSKEEIDFAKNYPYKFSITTGRSGTAPTGKDFKIFFQNT